MIASMFTWVIGIVFVVGIYSLLYRIAGISARMERQMSESNERLRMLIEVLGRKDSN